MYLLYLREKISKLVKKENKTTPKNGDVVLVHKQNLVAQIYNNKNFNKFTRSVQIRLPFRRIINCIVDHLYLLESYNE